MENKTFCEICGTKTILKDNSGFTRDYAKLLVGVNIGGLGTLIASMASLISYKIYAHHYNEQKGKYFRWFTIANVGYLAVLLVVYGLIRWM